MIEDGSTPICFTKNPLKKISSAKTLTVKKYQINKGAVICISLTLWTTLSKSFSCRNPVIIEISIEKTINVKNKTIVFFKSFFNPVENSPSSFTIFFFLITR